MMACWNSEETIIPFKTIMFTIKTKPFSGQI